MTFKEYQSKTELTAIYPKEKEVEYLCHGLLGECGELSNKYKKVIRGDYSLEDKDFINLIGKECGGIAWYLSQIGNRYELEMKPDKIEPYDSFSDGIFALFTQCNSVVKSIFVLNKINYYIIYKRAIASLSWICVELGLKIEDILEQNINVLQSRMKRGVIQGSGDNR